jgi:hypothetical protein
MTNALSRHTKTSEKKSEQYWKKQCMLLIERVQFLEKQITKLEATVARLTRDSSTSSKPPSSDIFKDDSGGSPPGSSVLKNQSLREKTGRSTGGQP